MKMNKFEQYVLDFFNARVERSILAIAADDPEYEVRKELRNAARLKIIRNPFPQLFSVLRTELEEEQGLSEESVFPIQLETEARIYLIDRAVKLGVPSKNFIPGWNEAEDHTPAELPKVLAYMGAMWLTRKGPAWATKKFRRAAQCRNIKIK